MNDVSLRRAGPADARQLAGIHIESWRETYAGMMPAAVLAGLDLDEWAGRWRENLSGVDAAAILALDAQGPAGFGLCRRQRSEKLAPLGFTGEITSLYLLRRIQRRGVGRRLLGAMAAHLLEEGHDSASVWVFRDAAHARGFYEAQGAEPTGVSGVWEIYGMVLPDMAYGFRDLRRLAPVT
ncbi:GNAT family N-acetyltransferase [Methylocystis parvus]|uniref:GNAT family N-acetyltransferase n=1 Tax=Methylocystis parvus TaxID=134 RepID=A0A6B8M976_9HYPH|nr:GNAT family N-acetyltransferase [Methylocystis parvus]QGM99291.1 GNAT family N-acetyltransferase [Methylocystis parvus]WBK00320.1 GNAT family N-acetyltransferase [Methylocystis parvus OBBP]